MKPEGVQRWQCEAVFYPILIHTALLQEASCGFFASEVGLEKSWQRWVNAICAMGEHIVHCRYLTSCIAPTCSLIP